MVCCATEKRPHCLHYYRASELSVDDRTLLADLKLRFRWAVLIRSAPCTCHAHGGKKHGIKNWSDAFGYHIISCAKGGFRITWHDLTVHECVADCVALGLDATAEPRYNKDGTEIPRSQRRGDVLIPKDPVRRDAKLYLDMKVSNPMLGAMAKACSDKRDPMAIHEIAESRKRKQFPKRLRNVANFRAMTFLAIGDSVGEECAEFCEAIETLHRKHAGSKHGRVPLRVRCVLAIARERGKFIECQNKELLLRGRRRGPARATQECAVAHEATMAARSRRTAAAPPERSPRNAKLDERTAKRQAAEARREAEPLTVAAAPVMDMASVPLVLALTTASPDVSAETATTAPMGRRAATSLTERVLREARTMRQQRQQRPPPDDPDEPPDGSARASALVAFEGPLATALHAAASVLTAQPLSMTSAPSLNAVRDETAVASVAIAIIASLIGAAVSEQQELDSELPPLVTEVD